MRLQPVLKEFGKSIMHCQRHLTKAREGLAEAQQSLVVDQMNSNIIAQAKHFTAKVIRLQELEEKILKQKSKLDWLKWGTTDSSVLHIDLAAMRNGLHLNMDLRDMLLAPISEKELHTTLLGIGDLKSSGINSYEARFFKGSWDTIKFDLMNATRDFFYDERLFKAFNGIVVTFTRNMVMLKPLKTIDQLQDVPQYTRSLLWTGGSDFSRKSPIVWDNACRPRDYGGLNIINLKLWDIINMLKQLWNLNVSIWTKILEWIQIKHNPQPWDEELKWLSKSTKDKGWRSSTLKLAATETFNVVWKYSNDICYGNVVDKTKIVDNIIDMNVYRG
ncbi:hypothetical protein KIW84_040498 [Lathyrus oleraceus]|uniref:Uncharacterized protein n=1 Tax=Pisum sativum TaxID=3888 RepID=A0A9D4XA59_PEA|nr:hypothetical protein KIW84_040498 [Pisum sativum]